MRAGVANNGSDNDNDNDLDNDHDKIYDMMKLMLMKLMWEVRYDKDGPMGEKTDRRVRTNHYFSFDANKIYQFQNHISIIHPI